MRLRLALIAAAIAAAAGAAPASAAPFTTAVAEPGVAEEDGALLAGRIRDAGARSVRLYLSWRAVAPSGAEKPAGFDPRDPADPHYKWATNDRQIQTARAAGLEPILSIAKAPEWAERRTAEDAGLSPSERAPGTVRPDPAELAAFATALARRYSGTFQGLPRVRRWQAWNEPNHHNDLNPQFDVAPDQPAAHDSRILSVEVYREMLNAFSDAVHAVHADNLVVAGGLAPFFRPAPGGRAAAPLPFMRQLLCLSRRNRPLKSCPEPVRFDVWSQHPYTSGDADHSANSPDDVSLGDLPEVKRVLAAAVRAKRIESRRPVRFWVTEFSWDSSPPDRYGVPDRLLTRWVAEALHRMWRVGVDLVTWFQVRDQPAPPAGVFQSGLYLRCAEGPACDRPKPMLAAFRFPFVAYARGRRTTVWGRSPAGAGSVRVEQRAKGRWVLIKRVRAGGDGVFRSRVRRRGRGHMRARAGARSSPAFSLRRVPDRPVNPFGNVPVDENP